MVHSTTNANRYEPARHIAQLLPTCLHLPTTPKLHPRTRMHAQAQHGIVCASACLQTCLHHTTDACVQVSVSSSASLDRCVVRCPADTRPPTASTDLRLTVWAHTQALTSKCTHAYMRANASGRSLAQAYWCARKRSSAPACTDIPAIACAYEYKFVWQKQVRAHERAVICPSAHQQWISAHVHTLTLRHRLVQAYI
eukprot:5673039-Pleurochrysis_carterae.AAC.3